MELISLQPKNYRDYLPFIDEDTEDDLEFFIRGMKGKRVAMVSATAYGGGVAEKLHSLIPLINSMGVEMDWWVIKGELDFFKVTKKMHNGLQGEPGFLTEEEIATYLKCNRFNAGWLKNWDYDFMVVHDPQPAALIEDRPAGDRAHWIWRCHIDTSSPNQEYWSFLYRYIKQYSATIFTLEDYINRELPPPNLNTFITPSIDPLALKNIPLEEEEALKIVARYGVETDRPLISQISRFDPWKDPLGVIEAYKIVKKEFPAVQLALVGSMAADDPEGWDYLYHTLRRAGDDYDIKVVTNFNGVTDLEVNAFQIASDVLIQKSLREGFGLTVAEGLWKETPVIGGNAGGIRLQIEDGVTGFLVDTVEECAEKALILLRNPLLARQVAAAGKEKVRRQFLVTKNALDYLQLFFSLLRQTTVEK
ncbi:MAG: glycosyltransferase [Firmicutes bacterium]|nr:glycosyltransferase [Bacillota bacterium]